MQVTMTRDANCQVHINPDVMAGPSPFMSDQVTKGRPQREPQESRRLVVFRGASGRNRGHDETNEERF